MKRIALIAAAALVLLSGIGGGAYFYFKPKAHVASNPETPGLHSGQNIVSPGEAAKPDTDASKRTSALIADLGRVQDRIIYGDRAALSEQNQLLHEIGDILRRFEKRDWDNYANVRAAFVYVLSGGSYSVLQPLVDSPALYEADRKLAQGIMLFAQGQAKAARGLFSNIDPRSLDVSLVGPFALARASLYIGQDDAKAISLLDEARLANPHTAIEEAAARREISILVGTGDTSRATMLLADYVRRFGKSIYAWKLFRDFSEAAAKRDDLNDKSVVDHLVATTATADQKAKTELFLDMAGEALLHGRLALAKAAADEVLKASPDTPEDFDKARLYEAAAEAPTANAADALKALQQITVDRLSDDDTAIHEVAGYIAHTVAGDELANEVQRRTPSEQARTANSNGKISGKMASEVSHIAGAIANADAALQQADMVISGNIK